MKASWEKSEKNQGVLIVEVDADTVNKALDQAFKKVVNKVTVPGFRKGKVPRAIFEAKYGVESLYQDAIDIILPDAYMEAVKETGIEPIDRPNVDFDNFSKNEPFTFKASVQVKPEVKLGDYKGIEVDKRDDSVSAEEVEEELKRMQERHAELVVVEEGKVENGDIAVIDYAGSIDGVPFDGGTAEKHSLEIGSGSFIPGFEEQVIGMEKGEERDITVKFPEEYHAADLAGKDAVFHIKLHDFKRKVLPELDDEFAKDVSEFDTLEEYKQDVEKKLQESKKANNEREIENEVIEKATQAAEVEIPEVMIDNEVNRMLVDFENRLRMQGMNMDLYYQFSGQTEEALREQMKGDAEKRVLSNLVLEAISKAENIEATEEEVTEELNNLGAMYQKSADEVKEILTNNGDFEGFKGEIAIRKTVKFLVEQSKLA